MRAALAFAAALFIGSLLGIQGASASPPPCKDHASCPTPTPDVRMSRLWTSGFEAADLNIDAGGTTASSYITSGQRSGARALRLAGATPGFPTFPFTGVLGRTYYGRCYALFTGPGSGTDLIAQLRTSATSSVSIKMSTLSSGLFLVNDNGGAQVGSASAALVEGRWYRIEVALKVQSGSGDDYAEFRLDGTTIASSTTLSVGTTADANGRFGCGLGTVDGSLASVDVDDVAVNDDQGSAQNSWPGEGRVVNLFPTSDNARATLWTGGAGGTSNLWDAVNNTPPVGTATETNTTQIEHAGGAAGTTDAYDANMTTYSTYGIQPWDHINVVTFSEVDGEDSATGTKLLNFEVLSNPTISSPGNVTAGNDAGALGTYPTGWVIRNNQSTVYDPTVAVATAPVMRVRRPETATRVASVCYMAMVVDYTPGVQPGMLQVQQAINRSASW